MNHDIQDLDFKEQIESDQKIRVLESKTFRTGAYLSLGYNIIDSDFYFIILFDLLGRPIKPVGRFYECQHPAYSINDIIINGMPISLESLLNSLGEKVPASILYHLDIFQKRS